MRDDELIRVDELAKSLCREMGLSGAGFGFEVVSIRNSVLSRAQQGDFTLYKECSPYPFLIHGLEAVHGGLRLASSEAALVRGWVMGEPAQAATFAPLPDSRQQTSTKAIAQTTKPEPLATSPWVMRAQTRAKEIVKESKTRDLYPSQENLGDQIASEFRKAGITGADGKPLSGATIKRHALKGISSATGKQLSTTIRRGK